MWLKLGESHTSEKNPIIRSFHSCGIFKSAAHQGRNVVIAAGGYNLDYLDSVEILDHTHIMLQNLFNLCFKKANFEQMFYYLKKN
jgi:hypothetical protein